jgi:hypothetical protein
MCRQIVDKKKLIQFLGNVAGGSKTEEVVTENAKVVKVAASTKNRIMATTELLDRGYGKPNQVIEVQVTFAMVIVAEVMKALRMIPPACPHCHTKIGLREKIGRFLLDLSKRFEEQETVQ